jgi:hypothetical protein
MSIYKRTIWRWKQPEVNAEIINAMEKARLDFDPQIEAALKW